MVLPNQVLELQAWVYWSQSLSSSQSYQLSWQVSWVFTDWSCLSFCLELVSTILRIVLNSYSFYLNWQWKLHLRLGLQTSRFRTGLRSLFIGTYLFKAKIFRLQVSPLVLLETLELEPMHNKSKSLWEWSLFSSSLKPSDFTEWLSLSSFPPTEGYSSINYL